MTVQNTYLIAYNALSFLLWGYITVSTVLQLPGLAAAPELDPDPGAARGRPRRARPGARLAGTTALQIGGKNLVVWTVMVKFPEIIVGGSGSSGSELGVAFFLGCVLAWGCSEIIRYGYFVAQLSTGDTPRLLKLLRYNAFLPLYPIGLLSEAGLVYLALTEGTGVGQFYKGYLLLGLITYLPAGPFLYTHMLSQRRKIMKQLSSKKE
ncbi:hypothetical protein G7054_g7255 [Neopestalotiopsis clavispora]|nr:hypothetical protein G7054_g7255 [Neopestalotiopsis clavispora]